MYKFKKQIMYDFNYNNSFALLEILENILDIAVGKKEFSLANTAIVYIHHPLKTSINLIDAMLRLGVLAKYIFVLGKKYSENLQVVEAIKNLGVFYQPCSEQVGLGQFSRSFTQDINWLWKHVVDSKLNVENLLILDHGGYASQYIPESILTKHKVVIIEKTSAGLIRLQENGLPPAPLINVASCAVKKNLESPLIAEAIINKLLPLMPSEKNVICGIIGYGAIGKALAAKLVSLKYKVMVHDKSMPESLSFEEISYTKELTQLIADSDYIFGCSGQNAMHDLEPILAINKNKTLISCSSEDKEFLSLLRAIQKEYPNKKINPLDKLQYITSKGGMITIFRGGFPINFDNSEESVPSNDIQLTRALALSAILQATQFFNKKMVLESAGIYALDPCMQNFISSWWISKRSIDQFSKKSIMSFQSQKWILENSEGKHEPCASLQAFLDNKYI